MLHSDGMRLPAISFLIAALLVAPAAGEDAKPKPPRPGTSVEMPFLIAPMSKDGKLLGYAYISSKLVCTSGSATVAAREKLAFIQDANVRDVNGRAIAVPDDPMKVDENGLALRLADNARRIVGAAKIVRVELVQVQFAPLHPSESTLNMVSSQEKAQALAQAAAATDTSGATAKPGSTAPAQPAAAATSKPASGSSH